MLEQFTTLSGKAGEGSLTCFDLVKCLFNLSQTEIEILRSMPESDTMTAADLAGEMGRDRSTVYRGLERLVTSGLVYKERRGGKSRGFSNVYRRLPEPEIHRRAEKNLDECYSRIKGMLREKKGQLPESGDRKKKRASGKGRPAK